MKYVFRPGQSVKGAPLGGKAAALAALDNYDFAIPQWFAVLPNACRLGASQITASLQVSGPCDDPPTPFAWPPGAREELEQALKELCPKGEPVAVRSSAIEEDGTKHSFAGQLTSFLWVSLEEAAEKVEAVWRSAFLGSARDYRAKLGLPRTSQAPAVLIQRMVHSEVSGVAFGTDPVSGRLDLAVVSAIPGLGVALVNGDRNADTWSIDSLGEITRRQLAHSCPALNDSQIRAVAAMVRETGRIFGRPQDIEWALAKGTFYLLQSRPITARARPRPLKIWDNSNIIESYSGVTTPLTFTFARRAYEGVYRQFCRMLAVPKSKLRVHDPIFRQMLGLIRGRVYYDLLNWYRVLALLPGFRLNHRFMEQMMGVKEGLPPEILAELGQAGLGHRAKDAFHLAVSATALAINHFRLPAKIRRFYARIDDALAPPTKPLESMTLGELATYFDDLEHKLLTRWDAPLLNDFFAMIFFGVLRGLVQRWAPGSDGALHNALLCGTKDVVSAEPALRLVELGKQAAKDPPLVEQLLTGSKPQVLARMEALPEFKRAYDEYLSKFGERCLEELKLESLTLHDDPSLLLRSIGVLANRFRNGEEATAVEDASGQRQSAERHMEWVLAGNRVRGVIFKWVLGHTRGHVRDRENLRFERTLLYGRLRRVFVEMGRRLAAQGFLEDSRDVFFLELDELLALAQNPGSPDPGLKMSVHERKAEFARFQAEEPPPNRIETYADSINGPWSAKHLRPACAGVDWKQGLAACPGNVRGRVRKIRDPRKETLRPGEIIVAERTDPGWILLFPSVCGLLVERGSPLSHSAIVARELGIPTIVGIEGLTAWLRDGEWVQFDGALGQVWRVSGPKAVPRPRPEPIRRSVGEFVSAAS